MTTYTQALALQRVSTLRLPSFKTVLSIGLSFILFLSVFYVFQVNELVKNTYTIKSYQKTIQDSVITKVDSQASYLENIQVQAETQGYQKVQNIRYIQILDSTMAKK